MLKTKSVSSINTCTSIKDDPGKNSPIKLFSYETSPLFCNQNPRPPNIFLFKICPSPFGHLNTCACMVSRTSFKIFKLFASRSMGQKTIFCRVVNRSTQNSSSTIGQMYIRQISLISLFRHKTVQVSRWTLSRRNQRFKITPWKTLKMNWLTKTSKTFWTSLR